MSDKVKLIIEIPKDFYENVRLGVLHRQITYKPLVSIGKGIPLDDVKAEIDKQEFAHHQGLTHWYMTPSEVKSVVFEILDNIDKAERKENKK